MLLGGELMTTQIKESKKGFTLIEIMVVIALLVILASASIILVVPYLDKAKTTGDINSLHILNAATALYAADRIANSDNAADIFSGISSDAARMSKLVTGGYMDAPVKAQQKGQTFKWLLNAQQWVLGGMSNILKLDDVTMGTGGFTGYLKRYNGSDTEIVIPKSLGEGAQTVAVKSIYQDAFNGKGLTSVTFGEESQITRIHARAFRDNNLTEIVLPDTIKNIDTYSFYGNNITKITIGGQVANIETKAFQNNSQGFFEAYKSGGAGTYVYENNKWVKK